MDLKLIHLCQIKNHTKYKHKVLFSLNDKDLVALYWEDIEGPIVYDAEYDEKLSQYSWNVSPTHKRVKCYPCNVYMHNLIREGHTIRHLTGNFSDNRMANLTNKRQYNVKKRPAGVLREYGIDELPKYLYLRADKFIISHHPTLLMNGQQELYCEHASDCLYERYLYALEVLQILDEPFETFKRTLQAEYEAITDFVKNLIAAQKRAGHDGSQVDLA